MTKKTRTILWSSAAVFAVFAGAPRSRAQQAPLNGFDDYVHKAMKDWQVPGAAIAIVKDDRVVLSKGYGVRRLGDPTPVDERTMFAIASDSKPFTTAALAMLVDEGKLKWDDPVIQHMPDFELLDPWLTRHITVRDLVTHRTFPENGDEFLWYRFGWSSEELVRRLRYGKYTGNFRERFSYNNSMYVVAGQVISRVAGQSYGDFVAQRIFKPLGMTSSNLSITALKDSDDVSTGYAMMDGKVQPVPWHNLDNVGPAGGINSNLVDMTQWLRLQLGEGSLEGHRLISSGALKEMHSPQMLVSLGKELEDMLQPGSHFVSTGLGWNQFDYRGHLVVEKGGNIDGQAAEVAMMPDLHLGFVLLSNMNNSFMRTPLMYRLFDAYLGGPPRDWSTEILAKSKPLIAMFTEVQKKLDAERVAGTSPSLALEKYAGTFHNDFFGDVKIAPEGSKLVLYLGPSELTSELQHWQYDTFEARWNSPTFTRALLTFVLAPNGKADELRFDAAQDYPFKRVPDAKSGAETTAQDGHR